MGSSCTNRRTPESLRQSTRCQIDAKVKRRTGDPKWWCETHGQPAWGPGGAALDHCVGSSEEPPDDDQVLDVDLDDVMGLGVWGALMPAFAAGQVDLESGPVHVHVRALPDGPKLIDGSYQQVRLRWGENVVVVDGEDARAWTMSAVAGVSVVDVSCRHCGRQHTDRDEFAVRPHKKHQCTRCSRDFWATTPSVGNPLASTGQHLGLPARTGPTPSRLRLELETREISGIAIWASSPAIVWMGERAEVAGLHVHAWDTNGRLMVDETFGAISIDGADIGLVDLRHLQVARSLPGIAERIDTVACEVCGSTAVVESQPWAPSTSHDCTDCGAMTRTRLRRVSNRLVTIERAISDALQ